MTRLNGSLLAALFAARPARILAAVAAAAVIASTYPVVFMGKSHVSPNFGTILLYDQFPTLPGYRETRTTDPNHADVGAIMWQFVPFSMVQHRSILKDGELPVWNRYNSGGTPLLAQGFSMIADPLHWIPVAADGAAWAWDLKYLLAKWLLAFGLGLIVLELTAQLGPAAITALAAPFLGFFVYRLNHPAIFTLCYAPWPLYCWIRCAGAPGARAFARWAAGLILANLALINSGTAKEAYAALLCLNLAGVLVLLGSAAPWRDRLLKTAGACWAGLLFLGLSLPIWYSFAAALKGSYTAYNDPGAFQIRPSLLLAGFDEAFFRPLSREGWVFNPSANFLVLAGLVYFAATLRSHFGNRAAMALAASALVPLSLSFGLVPAAWIVRVPFLGNMVHVDDSFLCPLIILWVVLAGIGFAAAARRLGTRDGRGDLVIAGLLLFALVFSYIAFLQVVHRDVVSDDTRFAPLRPLESIPVSRFLWVYLGSLLAALAGLGLLARRALARGKVTPALGLGLAVCTAALLWRHGQQAPGIGPDTYVLHPTLRANFRARSAAMSLVQKTQALEPSRSIGLQNNFFAGWSAVYGLEGINGPEPLINPRYRELAGLSALRMERGWRLYLSRDNLASSRPFLDFLNVRYYLDLRSDQGALGAVLRLVRTGDLDVYESRTAWPRAFFTDRLAAYAAAPQLMGLIQGGDGRPFAAAQAPEIASSPALAALPSNRAGRSVVPATAYELTGNSTAFSVAATGPGLAVLSEVWWPGYPHAELDGQPVRLVRVNHAFQGIPIPSAGLHRVVVRYRPRGFYLMLGISAAALALIAGSLWASEKFPGRQPPPK